MQRAVPTVARGNGVKFAGRTSRHLSQSRSTGQPAPMIGDALLMVREEVTTQCKTAEVLASSVKELVGTQLRATEQTLQTKIEEKVGAAEKTMREQMTGVKTAVGAVEKTVVEKVGAAERTMAEKVGAAEKTVGAKVDASVVALFGFGILQPIGRSIGKSMGIEW